MRKAPSASRIPRARPRDLVWSDAAALSGRLGVFVSSSEKAEQGRYNQFAISVVPYPGADLTLCARPASALV